MDMAERINLILNEKQLTQGEMGSLVGVTNSYISALKGGRNKSMSWEVARAVEEQLGYNALWVRTGEGPIYKQDQEIAASVLREQLAARIQTMPDHQIRAMSAFLEILDVVCHICNDANDADK